MAETTIIKQIQDNADIINKYFEIELCGVVK